MKITCALSESQIQNLYANIYGHMLKEGNNFDSQKYMSNLFKKIAEKKDEYKAAEFVQQVPILIAEASLRPALRKFTNIKTDPLKVMANDFNTETGIKAIIDMFGDKSNLQELKAEIQNEVNNQLQINELPIAPKTEAKLPNRFKTLSPFGGTMQNFIKIDPNKKVNEKKQTVVVESINPEKLHIVNTLQGIKTAQGMTDITDGTVYQGVKLYLRPESLDTFATGKNYNRLDTETKAEITLSRDIRDKNKKVNSAIAQVNQRVILVLSDRSGNPVYANDEGNLVPESEGGKLVYQFMRTVRKEDSEYTVKDIYNQENQLLSPEGFAKMTHSPQDGSLEEYTAKVKAIQQEEIKKLFDIQEKILAGDNSLLPVVDISNGVPTSLTSTDIELKNLMTFPGMELNVLQTIKTDKQGYGQIMINGNYFNIDRPFMSEDLANEIATILTDPNVSLDVKKEFTDQFIPSNIDVKRTTKKYNLLYDVSKGYAYFNMFDKFGDKGTKIDAINISSNSLLKTQKENPELFNSYKDSIVRYLTKEGLPSVNGKTYITYSNKNLLSKNYLRLAPGSTGFVTKPYLDFLFESNPTVSIIDADPGFYNYILNFTEPDSELGQAIDNSKKTTNHKTKKDQVVDRLKDLESITGSIYQDYTKSSLWDIVEPDGNRISFYNYGKQKLTEATDTGKTVSLVLNPKVTAKDGTVYTDVVEVYLDDVHVGNVAETDYLRETKPKSESISKADVVQEVTIPGAESPMDNGSPVSQILNSDGKINIDSIPGIDELYRRGLKKEFINPAKVLQAKRWWNSKKNAPLRNLILLDPMANIVNSDVFATFVINGARLADVDGTVPMGKINVNKQNGTFYQNLTVYHEAWHVFSQLMLTKEQKLDLYNELRNYTDANGKQPHITKTYRELEEILAEDFRNYVKTGKVKEGAQKRNTLFRRILDMLKQFFGKNLKKFKKSDIEIDSLNSPLAKELFDNLYFGRFNSYQASIDNSMLFELDRGVTQVSYPKQTVLSPQDSMLIVNSIDSIFSEIIDDIYKNISSNSNAIALDRAKKAGVTEFTEEVLADYKPSEKSASIVMLTDPTKRAYMYQKAKEKLQIALEREQAKLTKTPNAVDFADIKSINDIKNNAVATLVAKNGKNKYFFLTSQINDYSKLTPTLKNGERVKGEDYVGAIKIVGDYYRYFNIGKKGESADIIVVSRLEDAYTQYNNYVKAEAKIYTGVTENPKAKNISLSDEQELIRDNVRILQQALLNWGDSEAGVVKYHTENTDYELAKTKYEIATDETEDSTETNTQELNNDLLTGKLSLQQMMSKETIYILKSLFKVNKADGTTPVNRLGFKERADFAKVFTIVAKAIGGERDRYVAYEKLGIEAQKFPEIKQLFETKYPNPANIKNVFEFNISRQFWQDFSKPRVKYMQLFAFTDENGFDFQVKESSLAIDNTLNRWSGQFKSTEKTDYISKTNQNVSVLDLQKVVKDFGDSKKNLDPKKAFKFAQAIGIDMENNTNIARELVLNADYYGLNYMYDIVKDFAEIEDLVNSNTPSKELTQTKTKFLEKFKVDPIDTLRNPIPSGVLKSLKGTVKELTQLKRLAELQTKYGYDSATTGVIRANGNTGYQDMNWSSAASKVNALNSVEDINQLWTDPRYDSMSYLDPRINTHTRHLKIISNLFDANGKANKSKSIQLLAADGFSVANPDGTSSGNTTTELDPYSKFLLEFHSMSLGGVAELPRHSEKKFSYGIKLTGGIDTNPVGYLTKGKDKNLYVDLDKFFPDSSKKITGPTFAVGSYFFGYIQGEFDRIKKFRGPEKDKYLKFTGYNRTVNDGNGNNVPAGSVFTAFDSILSQDTKNKLYILADQQIEGDLIDYLKGNSLRDQIKNEIFAYFNDKTAEIKEQFFNKFGYVSKSMYEKIGYTADQLTEDKLKALRADDNITNQLLKGYLYNDWIHKYETSILMYGDHAQWNHDKEDWSKRIPGLTSDGIGFLFDQNTVSFINDVFNQDTYASRLAKSTSENYDNFKYSQKLNTAIIEDAIRDSIYLPDMEAAWREEYAKTYSSSMVDKLIANDRKAYEGMKEGDGMAYMTIDAYRTLHQTGRGWTLGQEELYQKIIRGEQVDANKVKDYFPVYKLHYFGAISNDLLPATAMHKYAVIPLIPGVNAKEGSQLEVLHKKMLKENVQYITFASGSKAANLTKDGKVDNIFVDQDKAINTKVNDKGEPEAAFTINPIYLANLKEVTVINDHFKKELPIATQTRGIIIDNLYNNGEVINKKNEALLNDYAKSINDYTALLKEELLNNIGFELVDGRYVGNLTQFVELIRDQLTQRDTPEHLIKLINTTQDKQLAMDLSLHPESDSIEKLLMSFIQKGLIKQKTNGEPLVQTPSTFTNGLWDKGFSQITDPAEIKKVLGTNTLPFYIRNAGGRSTEMKVAIALQGDFVKLLKAKDNEGNVIGTIDRLNELLKDPIWFENNREAVTLVGPRIPNDATNTIEAATVWHFLPTAFGNSIIVPTEIVAKAGSDYDGDKLFMAMPNLNSDGTIIKSGIENFDKVLKETKALEKEGKLPEGQMSSAKLINVQKKYLQNQYQKLAVDILMLPENYAFLTKPNGTYLVDIYAEGLRKNSTGYNRYNNPVGAAQKVSAKDDNGKTKVVMSPTRTFEAIHNLFVHEANLSLEPSLGIIAKLAKSHPIFKSVGAKMPADYILPIYQYLPKQYEETFGGYRVPVTMRFKHNTVVNKDGVKVISLAGEKTQKGTRISDLISHNLQGILDRAKETFPFDLKLVPEAMDVLSYMMQAGVDEEQIFLFLNQPSVISYFENQKLRKSSMYEVFNDEKGSVKNLSASKVIKDIMSNMSEELRTEISNKVNAEKLRAFISHGKEKFPDTNLTLKTKDNLFFNGTITEIANALNTNKLSPSDVQVIAFSKDDLYKNRFLFNRVDGLKLNASDNYPHAAKVLSNVLNGDITKDVLTKGIEENDMSSIEALAIFMNFIQLENQYAGMKELQTQFSPDTAKLTTVQQILKRLQKYEEIGGYSNIDKEFLNKLMKESILSSFNQDELIRDLILPLFSLRLNPTITNFIQRSLSDYEVSKQIKAKFGLGVDGEERFTTVFNNSVVNYIYQNYRSNSSNNNGELINIPESYDKKEVIINNDSPIDVTVTDNSIIINTKLIENDFATKAFLDSSKTENSYVFRDLDTFSYKQNPFPTLSSFYKYVIAREAIRVNNPAESLENNKYFMNKVLETKSFDVAYERFISERALRSSFNNSYIMGKTKYSYSESVINLINEFGDTLKAKYPILSQLSLAPNIDKVKVLQLNNKREAQGELANTYFKNIRDLADVSIRKVNTETADEDNKRISEVFTLFSSMMYYQHGVGNSKLSFVKVLDPSSFKGDIMSDAQSFTDNYLNSDVLSKVLTTVLDNQRFKNFTIQPQGFIHSESESVDKEGEVEEFSFDEEEQQLVKGDIIVYQDDVNLFKQYLAKSKNNLPKTFFTPNSTFSKFYNSSTGKREGMPQSAKWELQPNNLYNMVDQNPESREVYYKNVDLSTGIQMVDPKSPKIKQTTQQKSNVSTVNNLSDYTNHSGGAYGADTYWDQIGREFGVVNQKHYRDVNNSSLSAQLKKSGVQTTVLTPQEMEAARTEVEKLLGEKYPNTTEGNLKVRNYYQVANSDAVFAIAEIQQVVDKDAPKNTNDITKSVNSYKHIVKGGTNVAVQLGIKLKKPVFVWDLGTQSWHKWDGRWFQKIETPVLTKNFAGVGSRDIESYNVKNKEGQWVPRTQYKGEELEKAAKQAIRDVYTKTAESTQPSTTKLKEGVSELFESNPELSSIGTQEQYSQYLDSIFPNSKVKDIVYHGSGEKIEQFKDEFKATQNATIFDSPEYDKLGFFFTTDKNAADTIYAWKFDEQGNGTKTQNINPSVVNVSNPQKTKFVTDLLNAKNIDKTKDGYIAEESSEDYYIETTTEDGFTRELKPYEVIIVPKSEQIHILGTKQDIKGFKKFLSQSTVKQSTVKTNDQSITEDIAVFNDLVKANKGELPKSFTVGKRNWMLNPFANYDLVDIETGEIFLRNINFSTGLAEAEPNLNDPIDLELKAQGLTYLEEMQDQLAEPLAELGYDIKDLLNNLAKAKTVEDYNKIQEILNKLC